MKLKKPHLWRPRAKRLSVGVISVGIIFLGSLLSFSPLAFTNKNTCSGEPITPASSVRHAPGSPLVPANPAEGEESVDFAVIGDFGKAGPNAEAVASMVKSWRPDFIITTGDNNYPRGEATTIDANIGQYYSEYIFPYTGDYSPGTSANRLFPSLGNHDWRPGTVQPYLDYFPIDESAANLGSSGNERYYDFVQGPVHFFVLNSEDKEPDGATSDSRQAAWLQTQLAASVTPWQVVYFHHPPYSSSKHGSLARMQWPFAQWGADVVFSGHDHTYERLHIDGIFYFVIGLGGAEIYPFYEPVAGSQARYNKNYGAIFVTAGEAYFNVEFRSVACGGELIDTYTIEAAEEGSGLVSAPPSVETQLHQGNADDPAIWVHPTDPAQSLILGTYKRAGLGVYDLAGNELQFLDQNGGMNNVDLRYEFPLGGKRVDLVVATSWSSDRLKNERPIVAIYKVNPITRRLESVMGAPIPAPVGEIGTCMYRSPATGKYYVFMSGGGGPVEQWEVYDNGRGQVDGKLVRTFQVGLQIEGCVADDEFATLYVSEEEKGIWKYGAEPGDGITRVQVDTTGIGGRLSADVEGLTLYYGNNGTGYLIASSQGSSEFVVYERQGNNDYLTTFKIVAGSGIDEVSQTDGIDVTHSPLGPAFPHGVFVVHDHMDDKGQNNFKLVPWQEIAGAVNPALAIDSNWNLR